MAASSSSNDVRVRYDVFLSFSGEDTREGFTNHLYDFLTNKAIETFIDDRLTRGKQIETSLMKTIEESKIAVVIFSKKYASSSWCLDELGKIRECNLIIMPIFYKVKPENVREQSGKFGAEFAKLKSRNSKAKIRKWSRDLAFAATQSGWDLHNYRTEIELIKIVATSIEDSVSGSICSNVSSPNIGIDSLVGYLRRLLTIESQGVQFFGLWGMGGIGKTTIAEVLYHQISSQFDSSYFCSIALDVKDHELVGWRNQIISNILGYEFKEGTPSQPCVSVLTKLKKKKVLIVIDNVNKNDQVTTLVGTKAYPWFASGSKIVVTSRDFDVFKNEDARVFEIKEMNKDNSLSLFYLHAFKQNQPPDDEEYVKLSFKMINYAKGVPLALKVWGCQLFKRSKEEWRSALETLEMCIDPDIEKILSISYDSLKQNEKEIFLDIACFFKGYDKERVQDILDGCGFSATFGITRLIEKCLVTLSVDNKLGMHDLLRKIGQDIADNQASTSGFRRRFWKICDVCNLLSSYHEAEAIKEVETFDGKIITIGGKAKAIESIFLEVYEKDELKIHPMALSKMQNLRLLDINQFAFLPHDGVLFLPNSLRFLRWTCYPWERFSSDFTAQNAVELSLRGSNLKQLWNGLQDSVNLKSLKVLDLSYSGDLIQLPDLSSAANLKELILNYCKSLFEIPASIQNMNHLAILSLVKCHRLCSLPNLVNIKTLRKLHLSGCLRLKEFPKTAKDIKELYLVGTSIVIWPDSMSCLNNIKVLKLPRDLQKLPSTLHLRSLEFLSLHGCKIEKLPEIVGAIRKLDISLTEIRELPSSIVHLSSLVELNLGFCRKLERLPNNFGQLNCLENLCLSGCRKLFKGPLNLSGLNSIKKLYLNTCRLREFPLWVCRLSSLQLLDLSRNYFVVVPDNIRQLSLLESLYLTGCKNLQSLPADLPCRIHHLCVTDCCLSEVTISVIRNGDLRKLPVDGFGFSRYLFSFAGCNGLGEGSRKDIVENAMIRIQKLANSRNEHLRLPLTVTLPELEFPTPFKSTEGSSITVDLPTNWSSKMFRGFVFAVVVEVTGVVEFKCKLRNTNGTYLGSYSGAFFTPFTLSRSFYVQYSPDKEIRQCWNDNYRDATHATVDFESRAEAVKVLKCGVYLVYAETEVENDFSAVESISVETERSVSEDRGGFAMIAENFIEFLCQLAQCFGHTSI